MDLLSNGGDVDGAIGMDSGNFLARLKMNGVACYIVSLETRRHCDVSCFLLLKPKGKRLKLVFVYFSCFNFILKIITLLLH